MCRCEIPLHRLGLLCWKSSHGLAQSSPVRDFIGILALSGPRLPSYCCPCGHPNSSSTPATTADPAPSQQQPTTNPPDCSPPPPTIPGFQILNPKSQIPLCNPRKNLFLLLAGKTTVYVFAAQKARSRSEILWPAALHPHTLPPMNLERGEPPLRAAAFNRLLLLLLA